MNLKRVGTLALAGLIGAGLVNPLSTSAAGNAGQGENQGRMRVKDALVSFGDRADAVARSRGSSRAQWLREANDPAAWIDKTGALLFVDAPQPLTIAEGGLADASTIPYEQTFSLHSNPSATRKVFLDFDGHTVPGGAWSSTPLVAEPYSSDADTTSFTTAELDQIHAAWRRVAEDYAPFNVDVTTQDPGYAGINRASTSDLSFGTRLVVTGTQSVYATACPSGCGGVAYVGTVDSTGSTHDYYQPAWVFTNGTGTGGKNIAEAATHEGGHNLGLSHDGTATLGYYSGHGGWAPIMGVGYSKPVTQWSRGEYSGANQTQDDFAVANSNSIPLRADDFGSLSSPSLAGQSPFSVDGVISSRSDQDVFTFATSGGTVDVQAVPAAIGANLDVKLNIVDSVGTIVASNDPAMALVSSSQASGLNAALSVTLAPGTYRVMLDGVGFGDPLSTGYSDYGSLGSYRLTMSYPSAGVLNLIPNAVAGVSATSGTAPLSVTYNATGSSDPDGAIVAYDWSFSDGSTATGTNPAKVWSAAGTYVATLMVTDNLGGVSTPASVSVTVAAAPVQQLRVQAMSSVVVRVNGRYEARTTVTVTDQNGVPVSGVTIAGSYVGLGAVNRSANTSSNGTATLRSARVQSSSGTFTFAVNSLSRSGWTYNAADNLISTLSITY